MTRVESIQSGLILLQQMKFAWIYSDAGEDSRLFLLFH